MSPRMKDRYIIAITSGLGNQMLQYALATLLRERGENVGIYLYKKHLNQHNGLELCRVFNLKIDKLSAFTQTYLTLVDFYRTYIETGINLFLPRLRHITDGVSPIRFVVFPQWEDYSILGESNLLTSIFRFPELDERNKKLSEAINSSESVSIHIRRGDFQNNKKWKILLGDICDKEYYQRAISKCREMYDSPTFFVFSDDIEWARTNLPIDGAIYVDWNKGEYSYRDMQLMACCKANICANSTFSLVSAMLNINKDAKHIVPTKWENRHEDNTCERYVPKDESWIRIDNTKPKVSLVFTAVPEMNAIRNILKQTYSDFEVIISTTSESACSNISDDRIKYNVEASGMYVFNDIEVSHFRNRRYLSHIVKKKI